MGSHEEVMIEDGFYVLRFENNSDETIHFEREVDIDLIQFHFGLKGRAKFIFNQGRYALDLREELSLFLFNPQKELPVHLEVVPHSWVVSVLISIKKFHGFFSEQAEHIPFLSPDNMDKKYYKDEKINPAMSVVLSQLFHFNLHPSIKKLYFKGKVYELLSLYFNRAEDANTESCPFLVDEENVMKIRKAKDIVIANMAEPPGLQELADQVGINLKRLKMGFRQIYGDTVYSFLFDYKMDYARKLLDSGSYNVNEVGLKIGYSTASHFISAFRKKFGTTPKKYLMSINERV
ncbi:AraC family transcriptional regulator [uncultured Flavobacterium sp.]|uniref:helix-turn-helix transcriptional regulator n=1 Tax=uncultured Flavobacterium sp. TaxID=165435 RepID=UPI0025F5FA84|nr:AraC family transcriptional regulator [uncultured Flavobacterium sp.]